MYSPNKLFGGITGIFLFACLLMVRADEIRPAGIGIQSGAEDFMLLSVLIPQAFNQVIFAYQSIARKESPASVKLTVLDLPTSEILGEFLVNRYEHKEPRHGFSYEFRIPEKLQGRHILIQVTPD